MTDGILVSVVMANYQGARYLEAAIASVQAQSLTAWELILSDDASTDESVRIVQDAAQRDPRISVIRTAQTRGPGAARNAAFEVARGDWIAIVDSDDLLHPDRLARLLAAADRLDVDMIADDMILFGDGPGTGGRTLLQPLGLCAPLPVPPGLFIRGDGTSAQLPAFGYLKPMIRRAVLGTVRYDETLRVGEDFDLCLRLLLGGARYVALPDPMYLYRRHAASVSHRLSVPLVTAMIAAHDRLPPATLPIDRDALTQRRLGLEKLLQYERLVAAIKTHDAGAALRLLASRPGLIRPLIGSVAERLGRRKAACRFTHSVGCRARRIHRDARGWKDVRCCIYATFAGVGLGGAAICRCRTPQQPVRAP